MFDHHLRKAKDDLFTPIAESTPMIHPTWVTYVAFIFGLIGMGLILQGLYGWALACWIANRILDGFDGTLARVNEKQSDFGGYIDILLDFVVYAGYPIVLIISQPSTVGYIGLALLLGVYYVNTASWMYLAALLEKRAAGAKKSGELTSITMPKGIIGGTETVIAYCIFLIFPEYLPLWFSIISLLLVVTIIQRLVWAKEHLS